VKHSPTRRFNREQDDAAGSCTGSPRLPLPPRRASARPGRRPSRRWGRRVRHDGRRRGV